MNPYCEEVIISEDFRGNGTEENPSRRILQVHRKDGTFIAEWDSWLEQRKHSNS